MSASDDIADNLTNLRETEHETILILLVVDMSATGGQLIKWQARVNSMQTKDKICSQPFERRCVRFAE